MKVVRLIFQHLYKAQKNTKGSLKLNTFWIRLCFFFLKASRGDTQLVIDDDLGFSVNDMVKIKEGRDEEYEPW